MDTSKARTPSLRLLDGAADALTINIAQGKLSARYCGFLPNIGYGEDRLGEQNYRVHVLNDGSVLVESLHSRQVRHYTVEGLIRLAQADGIDEKVHG